MERGGNTMQAKPRDIGRFVPGHSYSPETQIKPGQHFSAATEIKPGQRLSARTEFKKGQKARNVLPVGSVTFRTDPEKRQRAWVKIAEPNKWRPRAIATWEAVNGPLPTGKVVHHKDDDCLNDEISNLVAITRAEHTRIHRREMHIKALASADGVDPLEFTVQWVRRGK